MLRANVAETVITPPVGTYMLEPSDTPTSGIHDDLYCRALAFDDGATQVAIVALDLLGVDAPLLQQIRAAVFAQTQLPPTHLMLTATHNHSAPVTLDCGLDDLRNRTWEAQLVDAVADCISSAMQNLQPVTLSVARGEGAIGVNRRVATMGRTRMLASPQGPVAPWVDVLSVQHEDGTLLALLFSHAAHPVTVHTASTEFNADYPGYAVQAVRQALGPDVMPMFAQGCAGDINVVSLAGGLAEAQRLGHALGDIVIAALDRAVPIAVDAIRTINRTVTLPFEPLTDEVIDALAQRISESAAALETLAVDERTRINQRQMIDWVKRVRQAPRGLWFQIQGIALGDQLLLVGMTHEPFVAYQFHAQTASPASHTMVFGYTNGCNGYVPTAEAFYLGGYEVDGAPKLFGLPRLAPESEAIIHATLDEVFAEFSANWT